MVAEQTSISEAVLAGCERVLARLGYKRMTMADVAEEASLSRRTLYLHFPTKEALVDQTLTRVIERTRDAMRNALDLTPGSEALSAMLVARIDSRLQQVGPFHHSLDEVFRALYPHSSNDYLSFFQPETDLLTAAIEKGNADGSLRVLRPWETAELLIRATNGFLPSNLSLAEAASPETVRIKMAALVEMLTCSLKDQR